ncbi:NADPH-dependent F420 reductase [Nocardioides terrigena]|uniref:NADPH-dependent F420 reductase n=1 Tax=Nocardioides terrigena TaxID=424797 RepID=UPI000D30774C|nr:NADPH-dependent F420 reductase [Nocardioides terrigena]
MSETVSILGGTGNLGYGLALRLGRAGVSVVIGSRSSERAEQAAERAAVAVPDGEFRGGSNEAAAAAADRVVVVAVPFANQVSTLKSVAGELRAGQVVLDATVPLGPAVGGRPTQLIGVWSGSAAQQARGAVPDHIGVVSGLHTLSAATLERLDESLDQDTLVCGDSAEDKRVVTEVLANIDGLRVVDAGRLEMSRMVEGLTPLLIGINIRNKTHAGIRVVGLS